MDVCEDPTSTLLFPSHNDSISPQMMQRVTVCSPSQNTNDVVAWEHDDERHDDLGFTGTGQRQSFTGRS